MYLVLTQDPRLAAQFITEGRIVAFPTGTAYGLAADALQGHALQRLRNLKDRPNDKTFTVFIAPTLLDQFFIATALEKRVLEKFSGKALTLLLTPRPSLAHVAQEERVGLRLIDHPLMAALAEATAVPLTATSANRSGQLPCYSPASIQEQFPGKLDETTYDLSLAAILDAGELPPQQPSTIARLDNHNVVIIRQGELTAEVLQTALE